MIKPECLLFDCMETVIDVIKLPDSRLYAWWAYNGSGYEHLWDCFDSFADSYIEVKKQIDQSIKEYEEYNMLERFKLMLSKVLDKSFDASEALTAISQNYWNNYKENCYVDESVKSALSCLSKKYKCGIVSNFMVEGGIEELLKIHDIYKYFDFVVTSINIGWKKPHHEVYEKAHELAGVEKEQILFIGDNYICDYNGPVEYGFQAVLLDKNGTNTEANQKIKHIKELVVFLGDGVKLSL